MDTTKISTSSNRDAYRALRNTIVTAGLLERRRRDYVHRMLIAFGLYVAGFALAFVLPVSVLSAAVVCLVLAFATIQIALLGHDAGHHAVFTGLRANWVVGTLCWTFSVGISFWWWRDKHNQHHGRTNELHHDPDLEGGGLLAFSEEDAAMRTGWRSVVTRLQAFLFPVIVMMAGFFMRWESWKFTITRMRGWHRITEASLQLIHLAIWVALTAFLGWYWLAIFFATQLLASLYFGSVVAPNHKGMPVWAEGKRLDFLSQQVLSSRNISSRAIWDYIYGGLNYQIEHHLFPTMPRANLQKARAIIKPFCAELGLPYEEVNPFASFRIVFKELNKIGRFAGTARVPGSVPAQ